MKKQNCKLFRVQGINMNIRRSATEHLSIKILPPYGEAYISAPKLMSIDTIQNILDSKQSWIIDQQQYIQLSAEKGKRIKSIYIHMKTK